jgi:esterase
MKLFYRKFGSGQPLLILHGLFGQSDNWNSLSKQFAAGGLEVYALDLRNHGLSPHNETWNYSVMAADVQELIEDLGLQKVILLGHSMGGMVAMHLATEHPNLLDKLIVADMAPKKYPLHHEVVIEGLRSVDFSIIKNRKDAEAQLALFVKDAGTLQFLLKNLYWVTDTQLGWRFNLEVIANNQTVVGKPFDTNSVRCYVPSWFIRGERSDYILDSDMALISQLFPDSKLITIPGAGHWIHAEQPRLFFNEVARITGIQPV